MYCNPPVFFSFATLTSDLHCRAAIPARAASTQHMLSASAKTWASQVSRAISPVMVDTETYSAFHRIADARGRARSNEGEISEDTAMGNPILQTIASIDSCNTPRSEGGKMNFARARSQQAATPRHDEEITEQTGLVVNVTGRIRSVPSPTAFTMTPLMRAAQQQSQQPQSQQQHPCRMLMTPRLEAAQNRARQLQASADGPGTSRGAVFLSPMPRTDHPALYAKHLPTSLPFSPFPPPLSGAWQDWECQILCMYAAQSGAPRRDLALRQRPLHTLPFHPPLQGPRCSRSSPVSMIFLLATLSRHTIEMLASRVKWCRCRMELSR